MGSNQRLGLYFLKEILSIENMLQKYRNSNYIKGSNPKCVFDSGKYLSIVLAVCLGSCIVDNYT